MNPETMAQHALHNQRALQDLLDGISPKTQKSIIRESSSKAVLYLSEQHPEVLLPHWASFVKLLKSDNGFSKYVAIHVIANLVTAGDEGRFEKTFNTFYKLLDDESIMVASHVAGVSGQIAKAKPALQSKITRRLLDIDKTHFAADRQALIISYALPSFAQYFADADARRTLESILHPKIRQTARQLLAQHADAPYQIVVVPLLFETGDYAGLVSCSLVVDCDETLQIARTMQRNLLSEAEVRAIMAAQLPRSQRVALADDVIENDGSLKKLEESVRAKHEKYIKTCIVS